jgi:glycosyltransferase involved in cell wall biosynthesis
LSVGGGDLADRVDALASTAGRQVVLAGERADVPELLPAFDAFALPSRYEGLPTAVAEAMACGVPVVATAVNAVADRVEPGVTGMLVPPARPELMADAIRYVLDSPGRVGADGRGGEGQDRQPRNPRHLGCPGCCLRRQTKAWVSKPQPGHCRGDVIQRSGNRWA